MSFEIDINELIRDRILNAGGTLQQFDEIMSLIDDLAERKNRDADGIAMIVLDCVDGQFSKENVIKQLKVNLGEFDY